MRAFVVAAALLANGPSPAGHAQRRTAEIVLAGGCYWGVESVFRHVNGVRSATSGFATPAAGTGDTSSVEAVRIVYDPAVISYRQVLDVFFTVAHDPTQVNRQGPDVGAEYRSVLFVNGERERVVARAAMDSLRTAHIYAKTIATQVAALGSFQPVGASQQNYAEKNATNPYIVTYDAPKLAALRRQFPRLYHR